MKTRLLFQAAKGSGYLGFREAHRYVYSKGIDSQSRDLMMAVDAGMVKRVRFANKHADLRDYHGIASLLQKWASTNGVLIPSIGKSGDGLFILVLASDEATVTNYLNSLAMDELKPIGQLIEQVDGREPPPAP
jgi:hypothetical protein